MNSITKNIQKNIGHIVLRTIGAIRVKAKSSDKKQTYEDFLNENNIEKSPNGDLSFTRKYEDEETQIKIPSEYIGQTTKIKEFIKLIDKKLATLDNPSSTKRKIHITVENGKMYEQGKRNVLIKEYVLPNGIESDAIETRTTIKQPYKERVK